MATSAGKRALKSLAGGKPPRNPPTLTQTQLAAPAGGTGATGGAYNNATNRDLMIASVNAARADIAAIMQVLRDYGIAI